MDSYKFFLIPNKDRTWSAVAATDKPAVFAAEFVAEQNYPVCIYYRRNDLNGSSVLMADDCADRNSLLESLNAIGKACYTVVSLWDYDIEKALAPDLEAVFQTAYDWSYEQEQIASAEMYESVMEDYEAPDSKPLSWSFTLDNGLLALVERNVPGDHHAPGIQGNIYDFNIWEPDEDGSRGMIYSGGYLTGVDGISSLAEAVEWVFQNYSRSALMQEEEAQKAPLSQQIQQAAERSALTSGEKGTSPER